VSQLVKSKPSASNASYSSCRLATPVLSSSSCVVMWPFFVCVRCVPGAGRRRKGGRRGKEEEPRLGSLGGGGGGGGGWHLVDMRPKSDGFTFLLFCATFATVLLHPDHHHRIPLQFLRQAKACRQLCQLCVSSHPKKEEEKKGVKRSLLAVCAVTHLSLCVFITRHERHNKLPQTRDDDDGVCATRGKSGAC